MDTATTSQSFLARHEFLIRRLHSLCGLIPVGAFMIVHLTVNASVLNSPGTFQRFVYQIHSLGKILPLVEWAFIFAPILFHGILGVVIIRGGLSNAGRYPYANNIRYTLQRASGVIALLFIVWHVFHMHGWFHFDAWLQNVVEPLGGAQFKPYSAASTAALAMQGFSGALPVRDWPDRLRFSLGKRAVDNGHHLGHLDVSRSPEAGERNLLDAGHRPAGPQHVRVVRSDYGGSGCRRDRRGCDVPGQDGVR